jgi:hypothetical protein
MSDPLDAYFQRIDGERAGGFSLLPEGSLCQFFTLDQGVFRPFFSRGYGFEHRYEFLEKEPELWAPLFEAGYVQIPSSRALRPGCGLWLFLDRVEQPSIVMLLELPPGFAPSEDFLRLLVIPDLRQMERDRKNLPVWLSRMLPGILRSPSPLLIVSEEGSGRQEVLAFIEKYRFAGSFVRFRPGRMAEEVQLREFFGDAVTERLRSSQVTPVIERSSTILIEEAASLAPAMQLRILSALSAGDRFWIFDTSRNLEAMMAAGLFDRALGQRLLENRVVLPPLRQQRDRLALEAQRYLDRLVAEHRRHIQLSEASLKAITGYDWPGNLQEFYETLEAAYFLTRTEWIEPSDLHLGLWYREEEDDLNLRRRTEELERKLLLRAHAIHGGNQVHMARALGISRGSLQYRWNRLGLQEEAR